MNIVSSNDLRPFTVDLELDRKLDRELDFELACEPDCELDLELDRELDCELDFELDCELVYLTMAANFQSFSMEAASSSSLSLSVITCIVFSVH